MNPWSSVPSQHLKIARKLCLIQWFLYVYAIYYDYQSSKAQQSVVTKIWDGVAPTIVARCHK